jgi:hypothetical protein
MKTSLYEDIKEWCWVCMSQYRFVVKSLPRRARWGWWVRRTRNLAVPPRDRGEWQPQEEELDLASLNV